MKATDEKKVDVAKEILVAYLGHAPSEGLNADAVCAAAKKIFETLDSLIETTEGPKEQAGFRL